MAGTSTWNPNAGIVLGLEWFPTTIDHVTLDHQSEVLVTSIKATQTQTVHALQFYVVEAEAEGTWAVIDVYENQLPQQKTPATLNFTANSGGANLSYGIKQFGAGFALLDPDRTAISDGDPLTYHFNYPSIQPGNQPFESWGCQQSLSLWQTRRPLWLRINGLVDNVWINGFSQPVTFDPIFISGMNQGRYNQTKTTNIFDPAVRAWTGWSSTVVQPRHATDAPTGADDATDGSPSIFAALDSGQVLSTPANNTPWTVLSYLNFIGGPGFNSADPAGYGYDSWGVRMKTAYAAEISGRIVELNLEGGYLPVEERISTGTKHITDPGWVAMNMHTPVDRFAANFTMTAGKTYFFVMRLIRDLSKTRGVGSITVGRLGESAVDAEQIRGGYGSTRIVPDNPYGIVSSFTDGPSVMVAPIVPLKTDGTACQDGVPYSELQYLPVSTSNSAQTEMTPTNNATVRAVKFVACLSRGAATTQPLNVALRVRSSGAIVQQATFQVAELQNPQTSGQICTVVFATNSNLTSGVQYYVEFTCPEFGWLVASANFAPSLAAIGVASAGGLADRSSWLGLDLDGDLTVALYQTPAAPGNFACAAVSTTVEPAATIMPGIALTWTPTTLGTDFAYYEIQRVDDAEGAVTIAKITTEANDTFNDWEHRINVGVAYRMRVVNVLGIGSSWAGLIGLTWTSSDCSYYFTANELPAVNVAGVDTNDGTREWESELETEVVPIYGREGSIAFQELERRGDSFTLDLLLYSIGNVSPLRLLPAGESGRAAFDPWLTVARAKVSYICVRNEKGDRWYSTISAAVKTKITNDSLYYVTFEVKQTTWTPTQVDES